MAIFLTAANTSIIEKYINEEGNMSDDVNRHLSKSLIRSHSVFEFINFGGDARLHIFILLGIFLCNF